MANVSVRVPVTSGVVGAGDRFGNQDNQDSLYDTVATAVAAAQAIGTGDASAEIDTLDTAAAALIATTDETLAAAVTSAAAAAQAIGVGDASAEIDTWDTAWQAYLAVKEETQTAALVASVAAAQAIGAGDASAEVDTVDTDSVALGAVLGNAVSGVEVKVDLSSVSTMGELREALEKAARLIESQGVLTK